ncbi:hypothetical protein HMN09_00782700 [Mycena chlorophos]|uniref:Uncharacterized protein n=1 Tax=Mycena chlorophos TaxID=658473 RepID=A0A8H6W725_MYCCL|nr:hypothetical protein HMN09_00782700 [Mycena chlorophos]
MEEVEDGKPLSIKDDFAASLAHESFAFDGDFVFARRFGICDAPNACLSIRGVGLVGSPLTEREVRFALARAPFVLVGAATWELRSDQFSLENPGWDGWVQTTVGATATKTLEIGTTVTPTFALQKLVIHGPNSTPVHFCEPVGDEFDDPKIGELVVVLSSAFEGAALQLRWSGQSRSLNLGPESAISTSVIAAYSGVEHTMSSVTIGFRVSLVYSIIQPIVDAVDHLRPTLPDLTRPVHAIRHVLRSWKEHTEEAPEFIAALLHREYEIAPNFGEDSLTGRDALLLSQLRPLAHELGFRLHFAHVQTTVRVQAHASGYSTESDSDSDEEEEIAEDEFEDDDDDEHVEDFVLLRIMELGGMPVSVDLDLGAADFVNGSVDDGEPNDVVFERHPTIRTVQGDTDQKRVLFLRKKSKTTDFLPPVYKRLALLIWPQNTDLDVSIGVGDVYDYALDALRSSLSLLPTADEQKIMQRLLICCRLYPREPMRRQVLGVLRACAGRWNDPQPFLQGLVACGVDRDVSLLQWPVFVSAYKAFGWAALEDFCQTVIKNDTSNLRRWNFLADMECLGAQGTDLLRVAGWCRRATSDMLHSLGPLDASQIPWLLLVASRYGGSFFQQTIYPQISRQKVDPWTLLFPLFVQLHSQARCGLIPHPQAIHVIVTPWVKHFASTLPAFPTTQAADGRKLMHTNTIMHVLRLCVETEDNEVLCVDLASKMGMASITGDHPREYPPWRYFVELIEPVAQLVQSTPNPLASAALELFFVNSVKALLSRKTKTPGPTGFPIIPCPIRDERHKRILILAVQHAGNPAKCFDAQFLSYCDITTLQDLAKAFAVAIPVSPMACSDAALLLASAAINKFDPAFLVKSATVARGGVSPADYMMSFMRFCVQLNAQPEELCRKLLRRFVEVPDDSTGKRHRSEALLPFLAKLARFLREDRGVGWVEPFRGFAARILTAFADEDMPTRPTNVGTTMKQLSTIGCKKDNCADCRRLRQFVLSPSDDTQLRFSTTSTHLSKQISGPRGPLYNGVGGSAGASRYTVTRSSSVVSLCQWNDASERGKRHLESLGDQNDQRTVLGAEFERVYQRIWGEKCRPLPLADSQLINGRKRVAQDELSSAAKKARSD